jgi:vacuolar-type H+-ATPase subunit E/Vma4
VIKENVSLDKTDDKSLESAIRDEAGKAIRAIALKEAEETERLRNAHAAGMEDFRKQAEQRTNARISQESSRRESKAGLELKKLRLNAFEAFINRIVEEVANGIRENSHYKNFLLDSVSYAVGRIPNGAQVRLAGGDLVYEKDIREAAGKAGGRDVSVIGDETIKWGGCIVADASGGRVFDSTIERIYYRKSQAIRREAMRILDGPPGDAS